MESMFHHLKRGSAIAALGLVLAGVPFLVGLGGAGVDPLHPSMGSRPSVETAGMPLAPPTEKVAATWVRGSRLESQEIEPPAGALRSLVALLEAPYFEPDTWERAARVLGADLSERELHRAWHALRGGDLHEALAAAALLRWSGESTPTLPIESVALLRGAWLAPLDTPLPRAAVRSLLRFGGPADRGEILNDLAGEHPGRRDLTQWALKRSGGLPLVRDLSDRLVFATPERTADMLVALRGLVARTPDLRAATRGNLISVAERIAAERDCPEVEARARALIVALDMDRP